MKKKVNKSVEFFLDWFMYNVGITRSEIDEFGKKVRYGEIDIDNKVIKNNFRKIFIEKTGISEDEINEFNKKLKNGEIDIDNKLN